MISPMTICYALKLTHDFARSEYVLNRTDYNRKRLEELSLAVEEIDAGKLEIEGYERAKWVKFDPGDKSTFPPDDGKNVLGYNPEFSGDPFECFFGIDDNFYCPQDKFRFPLPTHWRPLPPPPGKEEAK